MYNYNLIGVVSASGKEMLFCKRRKPPYQGLFNFVGGKIEPGEDHMDAAYRELFEETGIRCGDVSPLQLLMVLQYPMEDGSMEVYACRLNHEVQLVEEKNPLVWLPADQDYSDESRFAGLGNLKHILLYIKVCTNLFQK